MGVIMKWNDLVEARRNPEQNKRMDGHLEAVKYIDSLPHGRKGNYGVSMTSLPKLGVNPNLKDQDKETPTGIYYYPADYYCQQVQYGGELPHAHEFAYINVFEFDIYDMLTLQQTLHGNYMKLFNDALDDGTIEKICGQKSVKAVKKVMDLVEQAKFDDINPPMMISDIWEQMCSDTGALFWGLTKVCGMTSSPIKWNKLLRTMGISAVEDENGGLIHHNEPTQGVLLDPSVIINNKLFRNNKMRNITKAWYSDLVSKLKIGQIDMDDFDIKILPTMRIAFGKYTNFTPRQKRLPTEIENMYMQYLTDNGSIRKIIRYCNAVGSRVPAAEKSLMQIASSDTAMELVEYATDVIKGRWPEAEPLIAKLDDHYSSYYASVILRDPDRDTWAQRYLSQHGMQQ
jgi:hypothetical protein